MGPLATGSGSDRGLANVLDRLVDEVGSEEREGEEWLTLRLTNVGAGRSGLSAPDCSSSRSPRPSGPSPPPVTPGRLPGRGSLRGVRRRPPEVAAPASRPCAATPRRAAPSASRPWGRGCRRRRQAPCAGRGPSPARAGRSVTIPTSLSPSTTGREPTSSEVRRRAASTTVASLEIDGGGDAVIASRTVVSDIGSSSGVGCQSSPAAIRPKPLRRFETRARGHPVV